MMNLFVDSSKATDVMHAKEISFCLPLMNRLDDIKQTLKHNLDTIETVSPNDFEILIHCFDADDTAVRSYLAANFTRQLNTGLLRYQHLPILQRWHFGIAKSSFAGSAKGKIYSSLDGDNLLSNQAIIEIIEIFRELDYECLLHQFRGEWGDGTCGRISVPMSLYDKYGYDQMFMPRQFDEIDLILTLITQEGITYAHYEGADIFQKSPRIMQFLLDNGIAVTKKSIPAPAQSYNEATAIGHKSSDYAAKNTRISLFGNINENISFHKNCSTPTMSIDYLEKIYRFQRELIDKCEESELLHDIFQHDTSLSALEDDCRFSQSKLSLITVARNEPLIQGWIDYYISAGVQRIIIIDDRSNPSLDTIIRKDSRVFVLKPIYGRFKYAKQFWIDFCIRCFCHHQWVITADTDEYLLHPNNIHGRRITSLTDYIQILESTGARYAPGFLLDVVQLDMDAVSSRFRRFRTECESLKQILDIYHAANLYFRFTPLSSPESYQTSKRVKWAYGSHIDWAFRLDLRFRYNRTIDCLRKYPIFFADQSIHVHQGFHDLYISGTSRNPSDDFNRELIVPILHAKLLSEHFLSQDYSEYFEKTRTHLEMLRSKWRLVQECTKGDPCLYPLNSFEDIPLPTATVRTVPTQQHACHHMQ